MDPGPVTILRSPRRKKTIQTKYVDGHLWIYLPAGMAKEEEDAWVARMVKRNARMQQADDRTKHDSWLQDRARELNERYFNGTLSFSIRYVTNQKSRFGSCTHTDQSIRISDQVKDFPVWVKDYVIIHELSHLIFPNHSEEFWQVVGQYPLTERARGYLCAVADRRMLQQDDVL